MTEYIVRFKVRRLNGRDAYRSVTVFSIDEGRAILYARRIVQDRDFLRALGYIDLPTNVDWTNQTIEIVGSEVRVTVNEIPAG